MSATALWPHQQAAVDLLAPRGAGMLALDMGAGKTRTALELLRRWDCRCVLVLAPKSVVRVWPQEFAKHLPEPWRVLPLDWGTIGKRAEALLSEALCAQADGARFAAILNYDSLTHKPMPQSLARVPWDCLIMDESHRLKAPTGRQSQLVAKLAAAIPHRLALTGTPMPHSPLDIWAQFRSIEPRVHGAFFPRFRDRYAITRRRSTREGREFTEVVGYRHLEELQQRMAPWTFRVKAEDVLDLPETMDLHRYCLLSPSAQRIYHDLETRLVADIGDGIVTASNALARLTRLAQVANGFAVDAATGELRRVDEGKAELLADILQDLDAAEPLVVFGRFHEDLDTIHRVAQAAGRSTSELSGRVNQLASWQGGESDVLAVQLQAGGLGVDLTRARYQVYYALSYSLGDYLQTRKRIHRPGQTRPVTYIHLLTAGTVDEAVAEALRQRADVVGAIVDGLRRR